MWQKKIIGLATSVCNQRKAKVAKQSDSTEIEEYAMIPEK